MDTWGVRGTLAAVGVATVVAALGGAGIYAATGATTHAMGGHGGFGGPGGPGFGGPGGPPRDGDGQSGHAAALHSESVVDAGGGRFRTDLVQTGSITAIDATSVSAHSADGYAQTYVIPANAHTATFSPGDDVTIHATRTDGTATVSTITPHTGH